MVSTCRRESAPAQWLMSNVPAPSTCVQLYKCEILLMLSQKENVCATHYIYLGSKRQPPMAVCNDAGVTENKQTISLPLSSSPFRPIRTDTRINIYFLSLSVAALKQCSYVHIHTSAAQHSRERITRITRGVRPRVCQRLMPVAATTGRGQSWMCARHWLHVP